MRIRGATIRLPIFVVGHNYIDIFGATFLIAVDFLTPIGYNT